jgi:hypothetical protein
MLKAPAASSRLLLTERLFDCFLLASPYGEAFYCEHCSASGNHCYFAFGIAKFNWLLHAAKWHHGIPAVYVAGRQGVPTEWKAMGLELVIQEFSRLMPSPALGKFKRRQEWTVVMVNYDTTSSALTVTAERMAARFPDARFSFSA